jgi:3-phenylpropionate/trans-cinnamate dioxygenase ferredoxin reductase component
MSAQATRYLVVGGGMTGDAACKGIRELDPDGSITLVGTEPHPPYKRPPLTKGLWSGGDEAKIWRGTEELGVDLRLGRTVVSVDRAARIATDDRGGEYAYERLLLATGGRPRRLPDADADVVYFRTLDDYRRVRALADQGASFVVVGGGFIGSEIAAALTTSGCRVAMVFPDAALCRRLLPHDLAEFVTDHYRKHGVDVLAGETVAGIGRANGGAAVRTGSGRVLEAEGVIAGLGIEPATELAAAIGLDVDDGILVDELGRAQGHDDVFAAGDVARFPLAALGTRVRVEHEDHALSHGRLVGTNLAGAGERYDHLPFFYSDLFDLGYEAVGELDSRLGTLAAWVEPNRKGVIAYVDEQRRPRGILLWGIFGSVDGARELIRAGDAIDEDALAGLA